MPDIFRLVIAFALLGSAVALFVFGHWGWGILLVLLTILVVVTFFYNENMLIAQFYLRKENMERAAQWLGNIWNYERQLFKGQHGYYFLLIGLIESRTAPLKSEKHFKKALSLGLGMSHNTAMAYLSLAGIAMAKRNKREATRFLQDAKRADTNKLLAEQIKTMKDQMSLMDRTQTRFR